MLGMIMNAGTKLAGTIGNTVIKGREAFKGNQEKREQRRADVQANALNQYQAEFIKPTNWFDSTINGLNRTPRPVIANGTIGLFIYAFIDPVGFSVTMTALELVPAEMWWLLSSIVVFYFGARELNYSREHKVLVHKLKQGQTQDNPTNLNYDGDEDEDGLATKIVGDRAEKLDHINKVMDEERKRNK